MMGEGGREGNYTIASVPDAVSKQTIKGGKGNKVGIKLKSLHCALCSH